jgi:hypothetical protein
VLVRVGVGEDDQVLTADDDEDSGVKWADAGGGGSSGGIIWLPATRFGGFDTGSDNDWAQLFHELSTSGPDHELEGVGLHTGRADQEQTGILKCSWAVPAGSTSWATTGCIKIYYWGDDDTDAKINSITIYGRDGVEAYTTILSDTGVTPAAANTPYIYSIDVGDLDSETLTDTMTIAIETESKSSDCLWIHGVLLTYE